MNRHVKNSGPTEMGCTHRSGDETIELLSPAFREFKDGRQQQLERFEFLKAMGGG